MSSGSEIGAEAHPEFEPYPNFEPHPEFEPRPGNITGNCSADEQLKWVYVALMPLPLFAGLINVVVWLAATINRKKLLRQNYVYTCVTSTLLSNVAFLSFHLWDEIDRYRMPAIVSVHPPGGKMQVCSVCEKLNDCFHYNNAASVLHEKNLSTVKWNDVSTVFILWSWY